MSISLHSRCPLCRNGIQRSLIKNLPFEIKGNFKLVFYSIKIFLERPVNIEEIKKERLSENERFSVTSNEIGGNNGILTNLEFNKGRLSFRSNELFSVNKDRNSTKSNLEEDFKD